MRGRSITDVPVLIDYILNPEFFERPEEIINLSHVREHIELSATYGTTLSPTEAARELTRTQRLVVRSVSRDLERVRLYGPSPEQVQKNLRRLVAIDPLWRGAYDAALLESMAMSARILPKILPHASSSNLARAHGLSIDERVLKLYTLETLPQRA